MDAGFKAIADIYADIYWEGGVEQLMEVPGIAKIAGIEKCTPVKVHKDAGTPEQPGTES